MKIIIFLIALHIGFSASCQLSEKENEALDKLIAEQVDIEADAVKSTAVKQTFSAEFFTAKRTPHYKNNGGFSETVLVKMDGKICEVDNAEMLVPLINSSFTLSSTAQAETLRNALNLLLNQVGANGNEIVQKNTQWIIVTEEWFGDKNGYVVNTEANGKITEIKYESKLKL